ncbi:trichohyalin-like [Centruroides sculpturatus]|uniref:trichohyalin-like n=1 Tax=Centruroides sculpturatus TaxID=218467 RepID=UPI000C6E3D8C|nr:trichohyalin-like [Centruroides sculpturatus]
MTQLRVCFGVDHLTISSFVHQKMDQITCNAYNDLTDWTEKCHAIAYDVSVVRLPSLNKIGIARDVPSIGPLLTYHSQLDDLDLKRSASTGEVLWTNNGIHSTATFSEEESIPERENMSKKRDSIVEARLAFVADMVETKTNQENGEVEEVSRKVECFRNSTNDMIECFGREDDGSLHRFECIPTTENPLKFECYTYEVLPSKDSSLQCCNDDVGNDCQVTEELLTESSMECKTLIDTETNHNEEGKEVETGTTTLEDIERERRKIIEKQVVRRKTIESWTLDQCLCSEDAVDDEKNCPPSLRASLEKYNERKQKKDDDCRCTSPSFVVVPEANSSQIPNSVDFGSILEKKQELKHFWEKKMMEVVAPSIEEQRLPPVVVNGHCKLKQNGVIKCQETGVTEPELCRRPSPEGEESCVLPETIKNLPLEKHTSVLQEEDLQKKKENNALEEKELQKTGENDALKDEDLQNNGLLDDLQKKENVLQEDLKNKEEEKEMQKEESIVVEVEEKSKCESQEIKEITETNKAVEETMEHVTNNEQEKENNLPETEAIDKEKPIIPEIEITTCGENRIDDEEEQIEEEEYTESVLDREIRLQREREESLAKERETAKIQSGIIESRAETPHKTFHNQVQPTERPYCNQTTESRIALEIREMREREEELRRMRENLKNQTLEVVEKKETVKIVNIEKEQPVIVEKKSPVSETVSSNLGMFKKRDKIKVRPLEEVEVEDKPIYRMSKESPIEREIRLLKEREEELRREKGLNAPPKKQETATKIIKERTSVTMAIGGDTQRLLATNRIQQEIEEQTRRELDLRENGHIRTISRETTEKTASSPICKSAKFLNYMGKENVSNGPKGEDVIDSKPALEKKIKVDARFPLINRRNVSAESKIQQELLEMKAREEELRQQRLKLSDQFVSNTPVLMNGNEKENSTECTENRLNEKDQNKVAADDAPLNGRRRRSALIAQWEQRIQNAEGKS